MTDRGVAIVTGGPSAIGVAIAEALLADGWKLILADLAQGPLDTRPRQARRAVPTAAARSSISRRARSTRHWSTPCTTMRSARPTGYLPDPRKSASGNAIRRLT
jgi:NAD(P)-dependent dehydrogenase (short-subunit alcohol dehydrogenase family)